MAGSIKHIFEDGRFTFDFIENMGDAEELGEEIYDLINVIVKKHGKAELEDLCDAAGINCPDVRED